MRQINKFGRDKKYIIYRNFRVYVINVAALRNPISLINMVEVTQK